MQQIKDQTLVNNEITLSYCNYRNAMFRIESITWGQTELAETLNKKQRLVNY